MMDFHESWQFLRDFFKCDKSIVAHINRAIRIKSKRFVRDTNEDVFLMDILSLLPNGVGASYVDFLNYVYPQYGQGEIDEFSNIVTTENSFLRHIWIYVLSNTQKEVVIPNLPEEYIPYLLLCAFGIKLEWMLYGNLFGAKDEKKKMLFDSLNKGYKKWQNPWHFYFSAKNVKSKLLWTQHLSEEQLYPLMILLIVLRREWEESSNKEYVLKKIGSLRECCSENDAALAIICSIYDLYDDGDEEIRAMYSNEIHHKIKLHKLIVNHIIISGSYECLFDLESSTNGFIDEEKKRRLINIENYYSNKAGKRLLVDYSFPYTTIGNEDVFIPNDSITDRIYVSLKRGKDYKSYWRYVKDGELFDYIQIDPVRNSSGEISDNRPIEYRNHLSKKGVFVIVEDVETSKMREELKQEISNFRHDLKDLMNDSDILNLKNILEDVRKLNEMFDNLFMNINALLNSCTDEGDLEHVRSILKELDNYLYKDKKRSQLAAIIAQTRDIVESYVFLQDSSLLSEIDINRIKWEYFQSYKVVFSEIGNIGNSIKHRHDTLCSCVRMFGTTLEDKQENIELPDFLTEYIKHLDLNKKRVKVLVDLLGIEDRLSIRYNKAALIIMLNSIVDNAITHGFNNYKCDDPTIKIIAEMKNNDVLLKICNNGKPINISNDDYRTRGVFKGDTGHTGIGGYQISRYAELQGGYVEIPKNKNWNTEIHLYIKK